LKLQVASHWNKKSSSKLTAHRSSFTLTLASGYILNLVIFNRPIPVSVASDIWTVVGRPNKMDLGFESHRILSFLL